MDENKYEQLFKKMLNGFALHKIIIDEKGKAIDYQFVEVNKAFEDMTGLVRDNIVGKSVKEVIPGIEDDKADWINRYGKVALTGVEERFEDFSALLDKWFSIYAYSPEKGYFATIFEDVTARKNSDKIIKTKIEEIEKLNKYMIERELKMVELKKEVTNSEKYK